MSKHKFIHVELSSTDFETMKQFYGDSFGWTFEDFPDMNYVTFSTGASELGGGFNPVGEQNPPGTTMIYIHTDDIEASKAKIKAAGGNVTIESLEVPTVGVIAFFVDPSGNALALLQPEMQA